MILKTLFTRDDNTYYFITRDLTDRVEGVLQ